MIHQTLVFFIWIICSSIAAGRLPIMSGMVNQTGLVGENVTFICEILTHTKMEKLVRWVRHIQVNGSFTDEDGSLFHEIKEAVSRFIIGTFPEHMTEGSESERGRCINQTHCVLELLNVTYADQGWYTCLAATALSMNYRSAMLSVFNEIDILPPNNVSALQTSNGVLVTWDQPKTTLEVTSYRVYYKSISEDNFHSWNYFDTGVTSLYILLPELREREQYTVKVQAIYNNHHSRNVSRAVLSTVNLQDGESNTEDAMFNVYLLTGISAVLILLVFCFGFVLRRRCKNVRTENGKPKVIQSDRSRSDTVEESAERENAFYEEIDDYIHSYESITSNNLEGHLSLISNKTANEQVQDVSHNRQELGSLTTTKVFYPDNETTNYIHPVYSLTNSYTRLSKYEQRRIPDYFSSTNNIHQVPAAKDSEYVYGRIPDEFCSADNINQNSAVVDSVYVYGRIPDDFRRTSSIHQETATMDGRDCHSV